MINLMEQNCTYDLHVSAAIDIYTDETLPGSDEGELLVAKDTPGEVIIVAPYQDNGWPVYLVKFANGLILGCLETEIDPQDEEATNLT